MLQLLAVAELAQHFPELYFELPVRFAEPLLVVAAVAGQPLKTVLQGCDPGAVQRSVKFRVQSWVSVVHFLPLSEPESVFDLAAS